MIIEVDNISHIYSPGKPQEFKALTGVSLDIDSSDFISIIGHTGSGKSTLIQHLNGLIQPTKGRVLVDGVDINQDGSEARAKRQKIGMVFQYPENQLFEETIALDIAFGPKNQGLVADELDRRVDEAMAATGLDPSYKDLSPFELSGGQKRRVAIAGVLAMHPDILILDEPTAGLDPRGRDEILEELEDLHSKGVGIILVSHSMEDVARLSTRIIVMGKGRVQMDGSVDQVFSDEEKLESLGLSLPEVTRFMKELKRVKYPEINDRVYTVEEAYEEITRTLGGDSHV